MRIKNLIYCTSALAASAIIVTVGCGGSTENAAAALPAANRGDICGTISPTPAEAAAIDAALASAPKSRAGGNITIPVYFHVITDEFGQGDVADAVLADQITILNTAFAGAQGPGGFNTSFRFVHAGTDRTANTAWYNATRSSPYNREMRTALRKGSADDCNIYIKALENGLGGYGGFPWLYPGDPIMDGPAINPTTLPVGTYNGYNQGDVAVHEIGHWLGLFHTYEGGCTTTNDSVSDTPAAKGPNFSCPAPTLDTCTGGKFKGLDPTMNMMDSTPDACKYQFTAGQNSRMDSMWNLYRAGK